MCLRCEVLAKATDSDVAVHARRRGFTWSVYRSDRAYVTSADLDPAIPMRSRMRLLIIFADFLPRAGSWNFVTTGEGSLLGNVEPTYSHWHLAMHFESIFTGRLELMHTYLRYTGLAHGDDGSGTWSRGDRLHTSMHPTSLQKYQVQVPDRGDRSRATAE